MAYTITNTSKGFRFFGDISIEAGETLENVELTDDEALMLGKLDGVTVESEKPKRGRPPAENSAPEAVKQEVDEG